jgi:hypothetical protein
MEKDDFIDDTFLRELIHTSPLESPSENFVDNVMALVEPVPVDESTSKPLVSSLKAALPYIGLAAMVILFIFSSDLPFDKYMPASDYISKYLTPFFASMTGGFKTLFASRFVTFAMGIALSAGFLVLIEYFLSRRRSMHHPLV